MSSGFTYESITDNMSSNMMLSLFIAILFILFLVYMMGYISLKDQNCRHIRNAFIKEADEEKLSYQNLINQDFFVTNTTINNTDISYEYKLKDFYIKTAYNACCSGKFKNDYVDLCT